MTNTNSNSSMSKSQPLPSVPFLDIGRENAPLNAEIQEAIANVCKAGCFVMGPECQKLEESIAEICGVSNGIGCASGSDALLLSLIALDVKPGDEVIVPSFTFFATASAVWRLGAKPVFVDIDPVTYNLDPAKFEAAITPATKGVIPVHLFGQSADMKAIVEIAEQTYHGKIKTVASVAKPAGWWTGNVVKYDTIVELPNVVNLNPGMSAEVTVILAEYENVLNIPVSAVLETPESAYCWVVANGTPTRRTVTLGDNNDVFIHVTEGLAIDEVVVLNPQSSIKEAQDLALTIRAAQEALQDETESLPEKPATSSK